MLSAAEIEIQNNCSKGHFFHIELGRKFWEVKTFSRSFLRDSLIAYPGQPLLKRFGVEGKNALNNPEIPLSIGAIQILPPQLSSRKGG